MTTEKDFSRAFAKIANKAGLFVKSFEEAAPVGWPDLFVCHPDSRIGAWVELKVCRKGRPFSWQAGQVKTLKELDAKFNSFVMILDLERDRVLLTRGTHARRLSRKSEDNYDLPAFETLRGAAAYLSEQLYD